MQPPRLFLIDTYGFIFRAYHARASRCEHKKEALAAASGTACIDGAKTVSPGK